MPSIGWSPRIVPYVADQTVYLVIDSFRGLGTATARPKSSGPTDLETIIADLMSGQFNDPIRVVRSGPMMGRSTSIAQALFPRRCARRS
jgi:hypothetical protein